MPESIINCIKGNYVLKAEGRFPERILNIASTSGIYIRDVKRQDSNTLIFSVSRKGSKKLLEINIEGLIVSRYESFGLPVFLRRHKKRVLLFALPVITLTAICIFSQFIWRVEIYGGDSRLRSRVRQVIADNGIYTGALKYKIDNYEIKRRSILAIDDLSWLWVDVRGTTAKVKIQKRAEKPNMNEIHEPADVIALHSGVIEKMQVYCGQPLFDEGMTVEKGQVLITGVFRSENENIPTYYHHASGNVILRVFEKKTVIIPKKTLTKVHTGKEKTVFSVNFKKNNIKFSLNSGISYAEYDKIEKKYRLPLLPLSISKTKYMEAKVVSEDTDISSQLATRRRAFEKELEKKDMELCNLTEDIKETESEVTVTFTAECLVRTDKEIPIEKGETDGKNSGS